MPKAFTRQHPHIPWPDIVAFRNIAAHGYFAVDWRIVWVTAKQEVPELKEEIARLLEGMDQD
ncbi:HepT-like ribonuclease domain-containing protein [Meiothermus sp.]|uniref:HepT-like ribonuclease domain-containing protein n=1 Tax=Meiothermus sp. TaxID=1955249 RepID=UPI0034177366